MANLATSRLRLAGRASRVTSYRVSPKLEEVEVEVEVQVATLIVGVMWLPPVRRAGRSPAAFMRSLFSDFNQSICYHISHDYRQIGRGAVFAGAFPTFTLGNWSLYGD